MSIQSFSFGENDTNIGGKKPLFKGDKNREYRVSLCMFPGMVDGKPDFDKTPEFRRGPSNYIKGVGQVLNKGPEYTALAGEPPKERIATLICVWPTDSQGNVSSISNVEVLVWSPGGDKYDVLKKTHRSFPLNKHDITLTVTDPQFQKMSIVPLGDSILAKVFASEKEEAKLIQEKIVAGARRCMEFLPEVIGKDMSLSALKEKMGVGGTAGLASQVSSAQVDAALDGII